MTHNKYNFEEHKKYNNGEAQYCRYLLFLYTFIYI